MSHFSIRKHNHGSQKVDFFNQTIGDIGELQSSRNRKQVRYN